MLRQVDIEASSGEELSLILGDTSSGIILADIQGLDPVKATLTATNFAMRDGTQHQAARRESRDIVMRMHLDSRYGGGPVAEIRRELYRVFMPKNELHMVFHQDDGPTVETWGHVEEVAAPMFTKDPGLGVSIHCNDPDLIDPTPIDSSGEGYSGSMQLIDVEYEGSVASGIEFEIDISGAGSGSGFVLQQVTPRGDTRRLIFSAALQNLDTIQINTHPGQKEVSVLRGGISTSILYGLDPQSQWPMLEPGTNKIGVQVTGGTYQSYYEFDYYNRYGGL